MIIHTETTSGARVKSHDAILTAAARDGYLDGIEARAFLDAKRVVAAWTARRAACELLAEGINGWLGAYVRRGWPGSESEREMAPAHYRTAFWRGFKLARSQPVYAKCYRANASLIEGAPPLDFYIPRP